MVMAQVVESQPRVSGEAPAAMMGKIEERRLDYDLG